MTINIDMRHLRKFQHCPECDNVEAIIREALIESEVVFPNGTFGGPLNVEVCDSSIWPEMNIPSWGIGGYSPESGRIWIYINRKNPHLRDPEFATRLKSTTKHELHHAERWRNPGYGETLGEHLVSEGLAQSFELEQGHFELYKRISSLISDDVLIDLARRALPQLDEKCDYNMHHDWFYGDKNNLKKYPKLGGYALGVVLTELWLEKTNNAENVSASQFVHIPARTILDAWRNGELAPSTMIEKPHRTNNSLKKLAATPVNVLSKQ